MIAMTDLFVFTMVDLIQWRYSASNALAICFKEIEHKKPVDFPQSRANFPHVQRNAI